MATTVNLITDLEAEREALVMELFTGIYGLEMRQAEYLADAVLDSAMAYAASWDRQARAARAVAEMLELWPEVTR